MRKNRKQKIKQAVLKRYDACFLMTINSSKGNVVLRFDIIEKRNANRLISQFYFILFIYQRIYTFYQYKMDRFTYGTGFYHPK